MFNEVSWFQDKILMVSGRSHEALDLGSRRQGPTHWRFTTIENPENKPRELIIWIQIWRIYYNRNPNYNKKFPKFASKLMILLPSNAEGLRLPAATEKKGQPWILICQWVKNLDTSKLAKFHIPSSPSLQVHPELILFIASCTLQDVAQRTLR